MIRERLTGIGVALAGVVLFAVLIPYGIDQPGNVEHAALAPDFWPRIIAVIIMAMGGLLAVRPMSEEDDEEDGGDAGGWRRRLLGLAVALGALFGFYFLIPSLGMVVPGVAVILALMVFGGERRWLLAAVLGAGVPILLYVFFVHVAGIPIPLGVFENLPG